MGSWFSRHPSSTTVRAVLLVLWAIGVPSATTSLGRVLRAPVTLMWMRQTVLRSPRERRAGRTGIATAVRPGSRASSMGTPLSSATASPSAWSASTPRKRGSRLRGRERRVDRPGPRQTGAVDHLGRGQGPVRATPTVRRRRDDRRRPAPHHSGPGRRSLRLEGRLRLPPAGERPHRRRCSLRPHGLDADGVACES